MFFLKKLYYFSFVEVAIILAEYGKSKRAEMVENQKEKTPIR